MSVRLSRAERTRLRWYGPEPGAEKMQRHIRSLSRFIVQVCGSPRLGAEVGVWTGETTVAFLRRFPDVKMICVDPWETGDRKNSTARRIVRRRFFRAQQFFKGRMSFFPEDRVIVHKMNSDAGAELVEDGSLDFVFIDDDHLYEPCKLSLNSWWPKVRPGGVFAGHDYIANDKHGWGVCRAVDEFLSDKGLELGLLFNTTFALRKP